MKEAERSAKSPGQGGRHRPPETGEAPESAPTRRLRAARRALPLLFLAVVAVLAARELRGLDIHAIRTLLRGVTLWQLLAVQLLAVAGVLAMSLYDWHAARTLRLAVAPATLVRNAWIANAFNNLIGLSGFAGSGIRMLLLAREGVQVGQAAAFSALVMASVPVGLALLCWPLVLIGGAAVERLPVAPWLAWLALAAFAAYLPLYLLVLHRGLFTRLLRGLAPQSWGSLGVLVTVSTLDWLLAAGAAWAALAVSGALIPWGQFLWAFVLASALGILSLIPGGIGVFDTAVVLLLTPLVDGPEALVSGVLLYRLCYFLVPWLAAVYLGADRLVLPERGQLTALVHLWRDGRLAGLFQLPLDALASLGVRVLAYLTFGGGLLLLASAAFPAVADRLALLRDLLPGPAIEISHLLSVVTGVLLIALSRGIGGQVRSAYHLTQILLLGGALLSVLKGIDLEEAGALLLVALLLRRQRARFYRESFPLWSPRTLLWLLALVAAVLGFAGLGDWVHGVVPLGWEHLARFEAPEAVSRFSRGLLTAALVATAFVAWSFYRRPRIVPPAPGPEELAEAEALLQRHGGSSAAHLLFLGDKRLLWAPERNAFIQYGVVRDRLVALGDPCGDPEAFDAAILAFRDHADRHNMTPCFYGVAERELHRYHDAGFAAFKLGEVALVDLATFSLGGKRGAPVRHGVSRARREGAEFELLEQPLPEALWPELRAISDAWLAERGIPEKGFSLGRFDEAYLRRSPVAVVRVQGRVVAFANLMPGYGSREEVGVDLMRQRPDAPPGIMDFLFAELFAWAQGQGYRHFNLGTAPLGGVGESRYARAGERVARLAYEYGNRLYNYKGLRSFKEKFHPEWRSTYLAYPLLTPLPTLLMDTAALVAGGYRRIFFRRAAQEAEAPGVRRSRRRADGKRGRRRRTAPGEGAAHDQRDP